MDRKLQYLDFNTFVFTVMFFLFVSIGFAQTTRTSTGSTNWNTATTWTPAGVPAAGDIIIIRAGDIITVNPTPSNAVASITFNNASASTSGLIVSSGATLTVTGLVTLQNSSTIATNASISGAGSLFCGSLSIGSPTTTRSNGVLVNKSDLNTLTLSISNLSVTNNITLNNDDQGGGFSSVPNMIINTPCNLSASALIFSHTGDGFGGATANNFTLGSGASLSLLSPNPIQATGWVKSNGTIQIIDPSDITINMNTGSSVYISCGVSSTPCIWNTTSTPVCASTPNYSNTNVYNTSSITLTSGAGTNVVTTPINVAMTNITYATTGATGANFSGLPPGVTGSWSGGVATISGTPTTVGVYNYSVTTIVSGTCATKTASGTITTYVCPTYSLLSTSTSTVNVCVGSSSLVTLTANAANLPVGTYTVSYEIQGVAQTDATMTVTTAGNGSFVYSGFTLSGNRTLTITKITSGLCSSVITTNNIDTITVYATLAAPTASAGSGATCTQITANWTALSGTTYYELDVSTSNTFATFLTGYNALNVGLATSYNITGLTSGTTYYYRVRAFNGLCISSNSSTITYATASNPGVPGGFTTVLNACDELTVSWTAGSGATSYEIQWSTNASNFVTIIGTTTGITSLTYTMTGLTNGTAYKYRVRSVNGCNSSAYATSGSITLSGSLPTRPASVTTSGILCNQFMVTWPAGTGATSYKIEWSTSAANYSPILGTATGITALTYTITGLSPSTAYVYRVYSENGCGLSSNTKEGTGTTLAGTPIAPTGVGSSSILCTQFTMSWTASAGAISYTVERASDSLFSTGLVTVSGITTTTYTFTGLNLGTIYYYRVRAVSCNSSSNTNGSPTFVTTSSNLPTTPTISATGSLTFCETDSVTLGSSAGTTYLWSTGETTQFIFVTNPGNYSVQVTNASGCQSATSLPASVVVQGLPTASAGGSQSICSNGTATVSGATASNGTISWTENGAGSITSGNTTLTPTYRASSGDAGNTVTLTLTVTSNNSCAPQIQTATYTINVGASPSAPTVSTITQPTSCIASTGSVLLTGLPFGGTLNPGIITYSGTNYTVTGLSSGVYNYTITNGSCTSNSSDDVIINSITIPDNSWNGSVWSTGSEPSTGTERIVFNGNYTADIDLKGCSCQVNSGNVIIASNKTLTLTDELTVAATASITFNNNASLVQINNSAINSGSIKMIRTSRPMRRWSYIYAGSPIVENAFGQIPSQFDLKYKWTSGTMNGSWVPLSALSSGEGFIARVRNISPFNTGTGTINFEYTGIPKNGIVEVTVDSYDTSSLVAGNTALLANPYPSAIDGKKFLEYNVAGKSNTELGGTLFFWTSVTLYSGTGQYDVSDYASWNLAGGVGTGPTTTPLDLSLKPNGKIAAGQGFFTQIFADGQIHFDNIMRESSFNDQFFKNSITSQSYEKNRIWLNLYSDTTFKQMLVGYVDGATDGEDRLYDGDSFTNNEINIYSLLNNRKLVIQGKALPFNENDEVPIGYKITDAGIYSIAIDELDGIFSESQTIYLKDNLLNITHDIKVSPYQFFTSAGIINDRFKIIYINNALGNPNYLLENNIKVIVNNEVAVSSSNLQMESIEVYNVLGQKLQTYNNINGNYFTLLNLHKNNITLLLRIKLQTGETVIKKIIY